MERAEGAVQEAILAFDGKAYDVYAQGRG